MNTLDLQKVSEYIENHIESDFFESKRKKLENLKLDELLKRKNPYLFKAKGCETAVQLISSIIDALISSGEETIFGSFLEQVAIFVCREVFGGRKSGILGIDLEFEKDQLKYLVSIKSGPNWANSAQIKALEKTFATARKTLATSGGSTGYEVICVEGCCYGRGASQNKGNHLKLCGQSFWSLVSNGNSDLYLKIIEPLGKSSSKLTKNLSQIRASKIKLLSDEFEDRYCLGGKINWEKLVEFNSGFTSEDAAGYRC